MEFLDELLGVFHGDVFHGAVGVLAVPTPAGEVLTRIALGDSGQLWSHPIAAFTAVEGGLQIVVVDALDDLATSRLQDWWL